MDKENSNYSHSPLREKPHCNKPTITKDQIKFSRNDPILMAIEEQINMKSSTHIYDLMLTDPLLEELNKSLQKQAEQQKKSKMLETFPLRFKNLVQTQQLYKKLKNNLTQIEKEAQQTVQAHAEERQTLLSQLNRLKNQLQEKQEIIIEMKTTFSSQKGQIIKGYEKKIEQRQMSINQVERKLIKSRTEKENLVQYLQEMKEEAELLKKQNERIIKTITQKQEEISHLSKNILQKQSSYKGSKQKFIQQLTNSNILFQEKLAFKSKQCHQMMNIIEGYKVRMNEYENKLIYMCHQQQEQDNERFNEIQEVRTKLLQEIKQKNNLQEAYQQLRDQSISEIEALTNTIQLFQQEISNLDINIGQNNLNHQIEIHNIKENMRKIENSKDQMIEQTKQNIHLLTEEKLFLQGKVLKLQTQKQSLATNLQKVKIELDVNSKKIIDSSSENHKSNDKSKEIQKMLTVLKDQLTKYNEIIDEKQQKIQEYRKQIISQRCKIKDLNSDKQHLKKVIQEKESKCKKQKEQKDNLYQNLLKTKERQNIWMIQREHYQKIINKQKVNQSIQFQVIQGFNDAQQIKRNSQVKQLQKVKQKYENIYEQLEQYKKQLIRPYIEEIDNHVVEKEDLIVQDKINPYQNIIKVLQEENISMKELIHTKLYEPLEIQNLLDSKIMDLKAFYESKVQEQGKKYRNVIQLLKGQVTELYKQMDLKKSMEEQMYNEIVQINEQRNSLKNERLE